MSLSYMELLYLAAYLILVYEYVVMRHKVICAESDARIDFELWHRCVIASYELNGEFDEAMDAQAIYWNRGTK